MKKESKRVLYIFLRYIFLVLIALPNLFLFYSIFTPLTIYPVYFLLSLLYKTILVSNTLILGSISIRIIDACIAAAAYYLLLLLNFSVQMPWKKRIYSLAFSLFSFLAVNILRIFIFSILLVNSFRYFDITHKIFWFVLSALIVFFIWLLTIKIFKIKEIPFYNDLRFIYKLTKKKK